MIHVEARGDDSITSSLDGLVWGKWSGGGLVEFEADFSIGCGRELEPRKILKIIRARERGYSGWFFDKEGKNGKPRASQYSESGDSCVE